jgi:hypothetical protein
LHIDNRICFGLSTLLGQPAVYDEDAGDELENEKDLQMLDRFRLGNANEDDVPPSDSDEYLDMVDSDDETYDPANPDDVDYF